MGSALTPFKYFHLLGEFGWRHRVTRAVAYIGYKAGLVSYGGSVPVNGPRIPYLQQEAGSKRRISERARAAILTNEVALTSTNLHLFTPLVLIPLSVL